MGNLYKKYAKADVKNKAGGYKPRLYFAPVVSFLVCSLPAPDADNPVLGDRTKILADHTFTSPDGFIDFLGKINTATSTYTTVGDPGSGIREHTFKIVVEGNSPEIYEQLGDMLNDENVFLLKDGNCIDADSYEQWGDDCLTPTIKIEFDAKTTADGNKEHVITGTIREHKYWYYGTLTEKVAEAALSCPVLTNIPTTTQITSTVAALGTAHHFIFELYAAASGGSASATYTGSAGELFHVFPTLTTATTYYVHVKPVSASGVTLSTCARIGVRTL